MMGPPSLIKRRIPGPHQWTCSSLTPISGSSTSPSESSTGPSDSGFTLPSTTSSDRPSFEQSGHLLTHLTCTHPLHTHASVQTCHPLTHLLPYLSTETLMMRVRLKWTTHPALILFQMLVQPHINPESLECMAEGVEAEAEAGDVLVEAHTTTR